MTTATNETAKRSTIRVKMTYAPNGETYYWTVQSFKDWTNLVAGEWPRKINGWVYTDDEGTDRVVEGNWYELLAHFNVTASNYNMTHNLS